MTENTQIEKLFREGFNRGLAIKAIQTMQNHGFFPRSVYPELFDIQRQQISQRTVRYMFCAPPNPNFPTLSAGISVVNDTDVTQHVEMQAPILTADKMVFIATFHRSSPTFDALQGQGCTKVLTHTVATNGSPLNHCEFSRNHATGDTQFFFTQKNLFGWEKIIDDTYSATDKIPRNRRWPSDTLNQLTLLLLDDARLQKLFQHTPVSFIQHQEKTPITQVVRNLCTDIQNLL